MTVPEQDYLADLHKTVAATVIEALRSEGLLRDERPLLTLAEAGVRLGIKERSVRALVNREGGREPRLRSVTIGDGARRVEPSAVDEYIEQQRAKEQRATSDA